MISHLGSILFMVACCSQTHDKSHAFSSFRPEVEHICFTHLIRPNKLSSHTWESKLMSSTWCPWELPALSTWSGGISWNNERCNLSIVKNLNSELPYLGAIRCFTCESELDNWECNTKSPDVFCQPGNGISSFSRFDHFFFLNCREHFLSSLILIEKF